MSLEKVLAEEKRHMEEESTTSALNMKAMPENLQLKRVCIVRFGCGTETMPGCRIVQHVFKVL